MFTFLECTGNSVKSSGLFYGTKQKESTIFLLQIDLKPSNILRIAYRMLISKKKQVAKLLPTCSFLLLKGEDKIKL